MKISRRTILAMALTASGCRRNARTLGVRNAHAMAYDGARERMVLFGGANEVQVCGDTWEWNGDRWSVVSAAGPPPRTFAAVAYDSRRQRVVLFGGNRVLFGTDNSAHTLLDDTWEWDGTAWREHTVNGPSERAEAAATYDSGRGRVVLFGGYDRSDGRVRRLSDTWEFDGDRWTQVNDAGPFGRSGAALAFDEPRSVAVLFGGSDGRRPSGDTWEWDGRTWVPASAMPTEARYNTVMAYDRARAEVLRFGGWNGNRRTDDTWVFRKGSWERMPVAGPPARNHSAMVYDDSRKRALLFGGHDGSNVFGDLWAWENHRWLSLASTTALRRVDNGH